MAWTAGTAWVGRVIAVSGPAGLSTVEPGEDAEVVLAVAPDGEHLVPLD